ncbi:MAG: cytidine deaminase [Planctomycetales bacterium]|nr:cytidine deaminase [Planctomycetales bacterium]
MSIEPTPSVLKSLAAATAVRRVAHAPYSNYFVGAAIRTVGEALFTGCNVENRSYGLTICAERVAVTAAVAAGERAFAHLALALPGPQPPCGACLQVLAEFCDDLPIWLVDPDQDTAPRLLRLAELLPQRFVLEADEG